MIYRLFYNSRCTIRDAYEAESALNHIILTASVNNPKHNITGAMTFDGNDFAQVLEGEKSEVLALFEIIKQDKRHDNIQVVSKLESKKRYFSNWSMQHLDSTNFDELVKAMAS